MRMGSQRRLQGCDCVAAWTAPAAGWDGWTAQWLCAMMSQRRSWPTSSPPGEAVTICIETICIETTRSESRKIPWPSKPCHCYLYNHSLPACSAPTQKHPCPFHVHFHVPSTALAELSSMSPATATARPVCREHQSFLDDAVASILYGAPKPSTGFPARSSRGNNSGSDLPAIDALTARAATAEQLSGPPSGPPNVHSGHSAPHLAAAPSQIWEWKLEPIGLDLSQRVACRSVGSQAAGRQERRRGRIWIPQKRFPSRQGRADAPSRKVHALKQLARCLLRAQMSGWQGTMQTRALRRFAWDRSKHQV